MLAYLKTYAMTHLGYIAIIAIALLAFHSWISEHDARLLADAKVQNLEQQIATTNALAQKQIQVVTKIVHDTKTVPQAIVAIPQLTSVPLNPQPAPNTDQVSVDAIPLVQVLGQGKSDGIALAACQSNEKADQQIIAELKKPKSFWKRLGGTLKVVGVGIGIGAVIGAHL